MSKFKVGDKVRVRSWDSMEQEYGINGCVNINVRCGFTSEMERFCGKVVTIKSITTSGRAYRIKEDRVKKPYGRYDGEVIFTKENPVFDTFTVGKIYKVKNGIIKNDKGGLMNFKKKFFNIGFAEVKR